MIRRSKSPSNLGESRHIDSLIGEHTNFKGELTFEGTVRIDGRFEGKILSQSEGSLIISESAEVIGEVNVPYLVLHGSIRGNVRASKHLQIGPKGKLNGDVEYAVIAMAEGAAVNGRCTRINDREAAGQAAVAPAPDKAEPAHA